MAWHDGTFSCGCEGRVNVTGPSKDRKWKSESLFSRSCEDCYKKERSETIAKENAAAEQASKEMELPDLQGTEKQIAWANTLRLKVIEVFETMTDEAFKKCQDVGKLQGLTMDSFLKIKHYILDNQTNASYYINNRVSNIFDVIEENRAASLKSVDPIEKEFLSDIKVESTVYPENKVTDAVVEIEYKSKRVAAKFERNEDFRDLIKSLGYSWNNDEVVWMKIIKETTGPAEERVAELGNALLNKGLPIMIMDDNVRNNAVKGNFEIECTRWIYSRPNAKKLAIKWAEHDQSLYQTARTLPGSKWDNPSVIIDVAHHVEVMDFANIYGFKFTKAAEKLIKNHIEALELADKVTPVRVKKEKKKGLDGILDTSDEVLDDLKD